MRLSKNYKPRSDFVLFSMIDTGKMGSLIAPNIAQQGKRLTVIAVGPDVADLKPGDVVFAVGTTTGREVMELPYEKGIFITRQSNVVLVVEEWPAEEKE